MEPQRTVPEMAGGLYQGQRLLPECLSPRPGAAQKAVSGGIESCHSLDGCPEGGDTSRADLEGLLGLTDAWGGAVGRYPQSLALLMPGARWGGTELGGLLHTG